MAPTMLTFPESAKAGYFSLYQTLPFPSRKPSTYNIAHNFFGFIAKATKGLRELLIKANWEGLNQSELEEGVYTKLYCTTHGTIDNKTLASLGHKIGGELPKIKYLTGFSGPMLSDEGESAAKAQTQYGQIVICSDLTRALHHSLVKYDSNNQELIDELHGLRELVLQDIITNEGQVSQENLNLLIQLALAHDIVPTPLARAAFYGEMELMIERLNGMSEAEIAASKSQIFESGYANMLYPDLNDNELMAKIDEIYDNLKQRSGAAFVAKDKRGLPVSENRLLFFTRAQYLLDMLLFDNQITPKLEGRTIDIVTSSGFVDVTTSYVRYTEDTSTLTLERVPKSLTRGKSFMIALGKRDSGYVFLNDLKKLEGIKEKALRDAQWLRQRSLDYIIEKHIPKLVQTPLVEFVPGKYNQSKAVKSSLEHLLEPGKPVLLFGHGGQGKSMLALRILETVNQGILPLYIRCGELNETIAIEGIKTPNDLAVYLRPKVNGEELHPTLKRDFKLVYLLDDYHWLNPDFQAMLNGAVRLIEAEGDHAILLSRIESRKVHPPINPGFRTFQIDTNLIPHTIGEFIEHRVPKEKREQVSKMLNSVDNTIKGNYMSLGIITMIVSQERERVAAYMTNPQIAEAITQGRPLNSTQLYNAMIDYVTGQDIERHLFHHSKPAEEVRCEILKWVGELEELAIEIAARRYPKLKCLLNR